MSSEREAEIRAWVDSAAVGMGVPHRQGERTWALLSGEQAAAADLLAELDRLRGVLRTARGFVATGGPLYTRDRLELLTIIDEGISSSPVPEDTPR